MAGFDWTVKSELRTLLNAQRKLEGQIRKALKPMGKELGKAVKANCPIDSGALKYSITDKETVKKGRVSITVGPRTRYSKQVQVGNKTIERIPNLYAGKEEEKAHFMSDLLPKKEEIAARVAEKLKEIVPMK